MLKQPNLWGKKLTKSMKLVYKLTNSKTKETVHFYYGFSNVKMGDIIYQLSPLYGKTFTVGQSMLTEHPTKHKILVFNEIIHYQSEHLSAPQNIEIEYLRMIDIQDILKRISIEKKQVSQAYPFPPREKKFSSKNWHREIDPNKKTHEKYAARNYKGKLKI